MVDPRIRERLSAAPPRSVPADVKLRATGMMAGRAPIGEVGAWLDRQRHPTSNTNIREWVRIVNELRDT